MNIPLIDLEAQYRSLQPELDSAIARVLCKGNYVAGEEVKAFESEWAEYCEAKYCIGVSSGTDALYLTLKALGRGREVVVPAFTFFATVQAVIASRNLPVLLDVEEDGNVDLSKVDTSTRTIYLPVHLYGLPAYIPQEYGREVVEDSAQGHGIPLTGTAACFSFYPTKNLGAVGQAGAVVTNDESLAKRIREMRVYGEKDRFVYYQVTGNHRMDEIQAAILRVKLPHVDTWNRQRREIAFGYDFELASLGDVIRLPKKHPDHVYHVYSIRVEASRRKSLMEYLEANGVQTAVRYPVPIHLQPALSFLKRKKGDFPVAERWAEENVSLPIYPEMPLSWVDYVCEKIKEWACGGMT